MNVEIIFKTSFIISFISSIIGAFLKIFYSVETEALLIIGVIATLIFIIIAIYEVTTSTKISNTEKTMWTIAFLFFSSIAGLIYFLVGRKRIVNVD